MDLHATLPYYLHFSRLTPHASYLTSHVSHLRDGLKHSPDLSPLHIDTPADLAVDIQSNELQALYGSARRPALKELLGNVRRLSKDQVGCRLLQQR